MKTRIRVSDLYPMFNTIKKLEDEKCGFKFAYALAKNMRIIRGEIEDLEKAFAPKQDFLKYEDERIRLCRKFGKKDNEGKLIIEGQRYIIGDTKKFEKGLELLRKKYAGAIQYQKAKEAEYQKKLSEDLELELFLISIDDVPREIAPKDVEALMILLKDKK